MRLKSHNQQKQHKNQDQIEEKNRPIVSLMCAFEQNRKKKEWLLPPQHQNLQKIAGRLIGETYILRGPSLSGKASLVYWAFYLEPKAVIVHVDCSIYKTEMQFIKKLVGELSEKIDYPQLTHRAIAGQSIKFNELDQAIVSRQIPVVILIRNAERLVENKKQLILYNLLQWIATDIKELVGIVFTTHLLNFVDKFDKRARSRLEASILSVPRPSTKAIVDILLKRIAALRDQQQRNNGRYTFAFEVFTKVYQVLSLKLLSDIISAKQQAAHRDVVYYLNAMKLLFSTYSDASELLEFRDPDLKIELSQRLKRQFDYIFPLIPQNLMKNCNLPQFVVMALIYYMIKSERTPYRFKTIYEIYLEFKQRLMDSQGVGSAFNYSKNLMEKAIFKLKELNILEFDTEQDSVWNCDIKCLLFYHDIEKGLRDVNNLPDFIHLILNA